MKSLLKAAARGLLGEYSAYYVLSRAQDQGAAALPPQAGDYTVKQVDGAVIAASGDPLMRAQASYAGEGSLAYACMLDEKMVGLCFYWHGERYRTRNFWPLKEGEAKLVQIITSPEMRGRKVAPTLITASHTELMQNGLERAFARVWHSNVPSLRAFAGAGWTRCGTVVEVNPLRRKQPLRFRFA